MCLAEKLPGSRVLRVAPPVAEPVVQTSPWVRRWQDSHPRTALDWRRHLARRRFGRRIRLHESAGALRSPCMIPWGGQPGRGSCASCTGVMVSIGGSRITCRAQSTKQPTGATGINAPDYTHCATANGAPGAIPLPAIQAEMATSGSSNKLLSASATETDSLQCTGDVHKAWRPAGSQVATSYPPATIRAPRAGRRSTAGRPWCSCRHDWSCQRTGHPPRL